MSEVLNSLIATYESTPVRPLRGVKAPASEPLIASIKPKMLDLNASLSPSKRIPISTIEEVISRCYANGLGDFATNRAVDNFVSTVLDPDIANPTKHVDLLPDNHPLSTVVVSKFRAREITASFFESDTRIDDQAMRTMVASAVKAEPNTAARKFYVEALSSTQNGLEYLGMVERADSVVERRKQF